MGEMGGTCGTYEREVHIEFWLENFKDRKVSDETGIAGKII
jgi:hypothetical protein